MMRQLWHSADPNSPAACYDDECLTVQRAAEQFKGICLRRKPQCGMRE